MSGVQPHSELNQNQTEILRHCAPAGARSAGGGSPVQVVDVYNLIHNIQLSRNCREYTCYFCQLEKKTGKRQQTVWGGSGRIVYDNVGDDDDDDAGGGDDDDEDEDENDANDDVEDDNIAEDEVEEGDVAKDEVEDDDVEDDDVEDDDVEDDDVEDDEV